MPPIIRIGMKTAISEMLIESTVKPISSAPCSAACHGLHAIFDMTRDIFDHHDRVVHHESGGDREGHQREIVQRVADQIHRAESGDQRDRHRHAGDERGPAVAQEDEDHAG